MSTGRVIVLGAGVAGLGAARALVDAGTEVIVIEARDRIGGRSWTSDLWPDLPVDMGASWIHGVTGNPLTQLADEVGAERSPTSYDGMAGYDAAGGTFDFEDIAQEAERIVEVARDAVDGFDEDMSLKDAVERSPEWAALSPEKRRLIRLAIHTRVEHEYSGDWSKMSAWYFDDGDDFKGGDVVLPEGFSQLMDHLAEGIKIHLGETVQRLDPVADGVKLVTSSATYLTDKVIITLPLGVLKSGDIAFGAPFKKKRQKAIDRLQMGLLNKCWLRFDCIFWPEDVDWLDFSANGDGCEPRHFSEFTSFSGPTGVPLLVGFNAAASAETLEELDDAATVDAAMVSLRSMFGNNIPDPVSYQISRWRQDPFAQGAYSFQPVGTKAKTRRQLFGSDWDKRLIFAGEATSHDHPGTVHGALMTGRAAAALI